MGAWHFDRSITSISPSSGFTSGGTSVTIVGSNFGSVQGSSRVTFGGTEAVSYTSWSDSQMVCITPAHPAGTVDLVVTRAVATLELSWTKPSAFTYIAVPRIAVSPSELTESLEAGDTSTQTLTIRNDSVEEVILNEGPLKRPRARIEVLVC